MTAYIVKGFGTGYRGRLCTFFVADTCKGGCALTENIDEAKRFTFSEAVAVLEGRHGVSNYTLEAIDVPTADAPYTAEQEAEWNEAMELDPVAEDPTNDPDHKWHTPVETPATVPAEFDLAPIVGTPSFELKYDAVVNEITRRIRNGEKQSAKALRLQLIEWLAAHNTVVFNLTPANGGGRVVTFPSPVTVAA